MTATSDPTQPAVRASGGEPELLRGNRLRVRWFTVVTAGEFLGFCVPATVGALTAAAPAAVALAAVLAAGAVEAPLLGLARPACCGARCPRSAHGGGSEPPRLRRS